MVRGTSSRAPLRSQPDGLLRVCFRCTGDLDLLTGTAGILPTAGYQCGAYGATAPVYYENQGNSSTYSFVESTSSAFSDYQYYGAFTLADFDADNRTDLLFAAGDRSMTLSLLMNGRCFKSVACGDRGSCVDGVMWEPSCSCTLGYDGGGVGQCEYCSSDFYGRTCDLCPGEEKAKEVMLVVLQSRALTW